MKLSIRAIIHEPFLAGKKQIVLPNRVSSADSIYKETIEPMSRVDLDGTPSKKGGPETCRRFKLFTLIPKTPFKTSKYLTPLIPPPRGGTPNQEGGFGCRYGGADET